MIEAVAAEDKGDTASAAAAYPRLVEVDPGIGSTDKARNAALSGVLKVQSGTQGLRAPANLLVSRAAFAPLQPSRRPLGGRFSSQEWMQARARRSPLHCRQVLGQIGAFRLSCRSRSR